MTFIADAAGEPIVLKVAPPGLPAVRNRDVLRQARLMSALHSAGAAVPPVYFGDGGQPPFAAMGFVPGECVEPVLADERDPAMRDEYRNRGLDAARVLAAIHKLNPADIGLGDEPVVSLGAEIDRWTRAFETVPSELQHNYAYVAGVLRETMPESLPPAINHGDYRLGNTLCIDGRVASVIDWEIWSVGDPRIDIGWLTYFSDDAAHPAAPSNEPTGVPTTKELLAAYAAAGGASLIDIRWFDALTRYKEASATALLIKRAWKHGTALQPTMARMVPALPDLLIEAVAMLTNPVN